MLLIVIKLIFSPERVAHVLPLVVSAVEHDTPASTALSLMAALLHLARTNPVEALDACMIQRAWLQLAHTRSYLLPSRSTWHARRVDGPARRRRHALQSGSPAPRRV